MKERLFDIPEYEGLYSITKNGRVYSYRAKRFIVSCIGQDGYFKINLYKNGRRLTKRINRLVALTFIPNPENKPYTNHKNGIKTINTVENIEWVTVAENSQHAWDMGLQKANDNQKKSAKKVCAKKRKLTFEQAVEIRKIYLICKGIKICELAKKYKVTRHIISRIILNKTYVTAAD